MMPEDIISCVLDVKKIVPDDWTLWWEYWNSNNALIEKIRSNHNSSQAQWEGLDLYRSELYNIDKDVFNFPFVNAEPLFPKMISAIKELPIDISLIRAVKSLSSVSPHQDFDYDTLSTRILLYDNNPKLNFFYIIKNKKLSFQDLPSTSNTWIYSDSKCFHGTTFQQGYFKIILMVQGKYTEKLQDLLEKGVRKYPNYVVKP